MPVVMTGAHLSGTMAITSNSVEVPQPPAATLETRHADISNERIA